VQIIRMKFDSRKSHRGKRRRAQALVNEVMPSRDGHLKFESRSKFQKTSKLIPSYTFEFEFRTCLEFRASGFEFGLRLP
jgi:hypothetical protein